MLNISIMMYKTVDAITMTEFYLLMFVFGFLTDVCQTCETGYYFSDGVCQRCPNNCASCESASSCSLCTTGYYGETCSESCPVYCHKHMCSPIHGHCLSCIEGYFEDENKTCRKCLDNCAKCNSKQDCFTCKSGYKGEYCQSICSSCKPGTSCDKHSGYCQSDCVDGFSGDLCDIPCDSKCKSCNRYKQNECLSCASDRHGSSCNEQCSEKCYLNTCDVRNGSCTSGCIAGYWGEMCEQKCSQQCNTRVCYQSNGKCMNGYIDVFNRTENSTDKNFVSQSVIIGVITCVVVLVVVGVSTTVLVYIKIIRKRRFTGGNSSTSSKSSTWFIQCFKSPKSKTVRERKMKAHEDIEAPTHDIADEKENMIRLMTNESDKKNTENESIGRDASTDIERNLLFEKIIVEKNNRSETSHDKNETLLLITPKPENKDKENMESMTGLVEKTGAEGSSVAVKIKRTGAIEQTYVETIERKRAIKKTSSRVRIGLLNDAHIGNMNSNDNDTHYQIQVSRLSEYVEKKEKALYRKEFLELSSKGMNFKNQRRDLASSDMNRLTVNFSRIGLPVVLEDDPSANINANFIDAGPFELKAYIAYMGPQVMLMSSKKAFWKTVFQERCGTIVMLTSETLPEERCRCFSERMSCSETYGDITVFCNGEQFHGCFTVRKYTVKKQMVERDVQRLMFTKWPSYSYELPNDVSSFVNFLMYANKFTNYTEGPTLVFCSSGKQRTGTYIALDILTKQGIDRGFVDIFGCVKRLQEQRLNIISSCEQYEFLHKALVISLTSNPSQEEDVSN